MSTDAFLPEDLLTIPALNAKYHIDASGSFTHHWITVHALTGQYAGVSDVSGGFLSDSFGISSDQVSDWTKKAMDEIGSYNAIVDIDHFLHRGPTGPEFHFDSESFTASQEHIKSLTEDAIEFLLVGRVHEARQAVGRALHTLQDFYSHSNWIELGNRYPTPALIPPNFAPFDVSLLIPPTNGPWVTCDWFQPDPDDRLHLTSGYFVDWGPVRPWGCIHGGPFDFYGLTGVGLNKDTVNPTLSPHWALHQEAARVAGVATSAYFFGFYDVLKTVARPADPKVLMGDLLGVNAIQFTNNNLSSPVEVSIRLGAFTQDSGVLFPLESTGWSVPDLNPCFKCSFPTRTGNIFEVVLDGDWSLSITGLIGYTLRLPAGFEFVNVKSDRGTTTSLSGREHADLFVLYPVSGPGHVTNTYRIREIP